MSSRPLLWPALALPCGIWLADRLPIDAGPCGAMALLALLLAGRTGWRPAALAGWLLLGATTAALALPPGVLPLDPLASGAVVPLEGITRGPPRLRPDGSWEVDLGVTRPARGAVVLRSGDGPPPPPGATVAARATLHPSRSIHTPGQRDDRARLRRAGRGITARASPGEARVVSRGEPGPVVRTRRAVRRFLADRLAPPVDGLALALVLGDRSRLDPDLRDRFARAGTAHLLAISGLHVGVVALLAGALARGVIARLGPFRRRLPPRWAGVAVGLAAALAYGTLTGWALSTTRAAAMAAAVGLALLLRRRIDPLQVCAAAWIGLLLADPAALWEPATALSFGSVICLLRLVPGPLQHPWRAAAAGSAAVALGTAPLALWFFGQVPLLSVPANLIAIPVLGAAAVPALLIASATGLAWPTAGTLLLAPADVLLRAGVTVVELAGDPGLAPVLRSNPPPGLIALSLAAMAAALALPRLRWRWAGAAAAVGLALLPLRPAAPPRGELSLTALDVGHGDALLLALPSGERLLIDAGVGGPLPGAGPGTSGFDAGERVVLPALARMGVRHLDGAVITHLHRDHHGGMAAVLEGVPTDTLWLPVVPPAGHPSRAALHAARDTGAAVRFVDHGHALPARAGTTTLETLHPRSGRPCPIPGDDRCGANDRSIVLRVTEGSVSFLLTGDAEADLEQALLASGVPLDADLLKVPHHGSDSSSTRAFLHAVDPALALISADPEERRHRFPRPSVTHRCRAHGARVLVTGDDGTVQVASDGERLRVRTYCTGRGWSRWAWVE